MAYKLITRNFDFNWHLESKDNICIWSDNIGSDNPQVTNKDNAEDKSDNHPPLSPSSSLFCFIFIFITAHTTTECHSLHHSSSLEIRKDKLKLEMRKDKNTRHVLIIGYYSPISLISHQTPWCPALPTNLGITNTRWFLVQSATLCCWLLYFPWGMAHLGETLLLSVIGSYHASKIPIGYL